MSAYSYTVASVKTLHSLLEQEFVAFKNYFLTKKKLSLMVE